MDIGNYSYFNNYETKFLRAPRIKRGPYESSSTWSSLTDKESKAYRVRETSWNSV